VQTVVLGLVLARVFLAAAPTPTKEAPAGAGRFYEVRGVRLYTEVFGSGAPVLFLHGGLHNFDNSFGPQREYFSSFRKVIGVDQRGHGHSPDNAQPFSYQDMAEDTAALIQLLGVGPVDVVGHSDGANVALLLARDHPQLVRRVVVSGANLRSGLSEEETKQRSRQTAQEVSDELPPVFRADYVKIAPGGAAHWLVVVEKSKQLWMTPVVFPTADLKRLTMPVLVIAGDRDFTSLEDNAELFRGLPQAQLFIVPGTGHGTFTGRPELLNAAIRTFLEQPPLGSHP